MIWVRSSNGVFFGVCEGIAKNLGFQAWVLRLILLVAVLFFGAGLFTYLCLAISLPREDKIMDSKEPKLLGVSYRLSKSVDLDLGLIRFLFLFLTFFSVGSTIILYVILHFVIGPIQDDINS